MVRRDPGLVISAQQIRWDAVPPGRWEPLRTCGLLRMANPGIVGVIVLHAGDQAIGLFESSAGFLLCQIELATLACRVGFEPTSLRDQRMYPHNVRTMRPYGSGATSV